MTVYVRSCKQKGFSLLSGLANPKQWWKENLLIRVLLYLSGKKPVYLGYCKELDDGLWGHRPWRDRTQKPFSFSL
jgi:hypothetical protein